MLKNALLFFSNFKIRTRIMLSVGLILILLTLIAGLSTYSLTRTRSDISALVEVRQPAVIASLELANALGSANASLGFYLTSNETIHQNNYIMALRVLSDSITQL